LIKIFETDLPSVYDRSDTRVIIQRGSGTRTGNLKGASVPNGGAIWNGDALSTKNTSMFTNITLTKIVAGTQYMELKLDG
jgi:hypothetical protein